MIAAVVAVLVAELLALTAAAGWQAAKPPGRRRPAVAVWLAWNVLTFWWAWRACWGWVLTRGTRAAERVCDAHERAQAQATYPDPHV